MGFPQYHPASVPARSIRSFRTLANPRRNAMFRVLGGQCFLCGTDRKLSFDHRFGSPRNGHKRTENFAQLFCDLARGELRLLCRSCNSRQGAYRTNRTFDKINVACNPLLTLSADDTRIFQGGSTWCFRHSTIQHACNALVMADLSRAAQGGEGMSLLARRYFSLVYM